MAKILVVDDEVDLQLLIKQKFREQIINKDFDFSFAYNGVEALEVLKKEPGIVMVVSDINMPEMDGLTLINKINELYPNVICLIISAYGDMSNIRAAMNLGAFDFVTKPINFNDLHISMSQALNQISLIRSAETNKLKLNAIMQELNLAANIQQSILPKKFLLNPEIELFATMMPARKVGGDFYDFFYLRKDLLAFLIADVSDKGVPAALFMTVARTLLRAYSQIQKSPALCLQKVNELLANSSENVNMMFVTTFYGQIDLQTGHVVYANAGHVRPFMISSDNSLSKLPSTHGIPLGIDADFIFQEAELTLLPGNTLFLYTDGLTDAMNKVEEEFGVERLLELLKEYSNQPIEKLIAEIKLIVEEFSKDQDQFDDITMLALKYRPGGSL